MADDREQLREHKARRPRAGTVIGSFGGVQSPSSATPVIGALEPVRSGAPAGDAGQRRDGCAHPGAPDAARRVCPLTVAIPSLLARAGKFSATFWSCPRTLTDSPTTCAGFVSMRRRSRAKLSTLAGRSG